MPEIDFTANVTLIYLNLSAFNYILERKFKTGNFN